MTILLVWFLCGALTVINSRNVLQSGEIRIAVYKTTTSRFGGTIGQNKSTYFAEYYYKDDNGIEYTGLSPLGYSSEKEAEKLIGSQVKIKIDGKGESMPVGIEVDDPTLYIIISSVSFILILGLIFILVLEGLKKKRRALTYRELFQRDKKDEREM